VTRGRKGTTEDRPLTGRGTARWEKGKGASKDKTNTGIPDAGREKPEKNTTSRRKDHEETAGTRENVGGLVREGRENNHSVGRNADERTRKPGKGALDKTWVSVHSSYCRRKREKKDLTASEDMFPTRSEETFTNNENV